MIILITVFLSVKIGNTKKADVSLNELITTLWGLLNGCWTTNWFIVNKMSNGCSEILSPPAFAANHYPVPGPLRMQASLGWG